MRRALLAAALLALAAPATAAAAPSLVPVADFAGPVHVAGPPGDADRLFVVERAGTVQLRAGGTTSPFARYADITAQGGERGLLSIAFPRDYAASGLFYVFLTAQAGAFPGIGLGDLVVLEGRRSPANPNAADPAYRRLVFSVPHREEDNHNGGQLAFGPDGALYAGTGDGGSQGDPGDDAQRTDSLLGKLLRIDVRTGATAPSIHALGLRNPWRFSFDRVSGDLVIGDVGGNLQEEIDFAPAGTPAGVNYGWSRCEGTAATPSCAGFAPPAVALAHADGYRAVIGGFVVRDPGVPSLVGRYVFGDLGQPELRSVALPGGAVRREPSLPVTAPTSFGEDGCGRVHVAHGGTVSRLAEAASTACVVPPAAPPAPVGAQSPGIPAPAAPGPAADRRACSLAVSRTRRSRIRRVVVRLRADEACRATVRARGYRTRTVRLAAGAPRTVVLRLARRSLRTRERVRRTVRVTAVDAAGNVSSRARRMTLKRP